MGAPKRLRKKYDTPGMLWDTDRIRVEHGLKEKYGLKNLRELWIAETELRRIRKSVMNILAGRESEETGQAIIRRLASYGIVPHDATIDSLLSLTPEALLNRRLQTVVYQKGLAKTLRQARQLIVHGFIAIDGRKVTVPSYRVKPEEESKIGYYRPININAGQANNAPAAQPQEEGEKAEQESEGEVNG